MLRMRLWWLILVVSGCKKEVPALPDSPYFGEVVPPAYTQPRLVSVGQVGAVDYNADGYPTAMDALYKHFDFVWDAGLLVSATAMFLPAGDFQRTVTANFTFEDGRLTTVHSSCTGSCPAMTRTDMLAYDAAGALTDWSTTGPATTRHYDYDTHDRLISETTDSGMATLYYARDDGCLTQDSAVPFSMTYRDGRLSRFQGANVEYDDTGRILRFDSTGIAFHDLLYADGEARGIDLWPGLYNGGFPYGFPVRGELLRLDGTCDPTQRSQMVILGLVVSSLL